MSTITLSQAREELVVFLRNSDLLTVSQRGVTTTSENFSGTGSSQIITLSNNVVRNIRSVTVGGTAQAVYRDYTPSYDVSTTTITGTFVSGTDNITVSYDYSSGTTEKVWPDYPQLVYLVDDVPRIGFDFTAHRTEVLGIGSNPNWLSDSLVTVKFYDKNPKSIDGYISTFRTKLKAAQTSFYWFPFVTVTNIGPLITHSELSKKVMERSVDMTLRFGFEQ